MENILMPGYRINEYLLVLLPHEELRNKIHTIQQQFADKYNNKLLLTSKPNIPLVKFTQYEMMEERMLNKVKTVAMGFHPVKIELSGFGSFPTHTIFINVVTKAPIQDLIRELRTEAQKLMRMNDDNRPHFFMEPHITIGRKLLPSQYESGLQEFSHRHFTGRFIADSMLLLKRPKGTFAYKIIQRLQFENLFMPTAKQGALFQ
jgi:2'-5' RNA ligase